MSHKMLTSEPVLDLEKKIVERLKTDHPKAKVFGVLAMAGWMARNFTKEEFELMEKIEISVGEQEAATWFHTVMMSAFPEKFTDQVAA